MRCHQAPVYGLQIPTEHKEPITELLEPLFDQNRMELTKTSSQELPLKVEEIESPLPELSKLPSFPDWELEDDKEHTEVDEDAGRQESSNSDRDSIGSEDSDSTMELNPTKAKRSLSSPLLTQDEKVNPTRSFSFPIQLERKYSPNLLIDEPSCKRPRLALNQPQPQPSWHSVPFYSPALQFEEEKYRLPQLSQLLLLTQVQQQLVTQRLLRELFVQQPLYWQVPVLQAPLQPSSSACDELGKDLYHMNMGPESESEPTSPENEDGDGGERQYICGLCKRTLKHKRTWQRHMREHESPRPHKCEICPKRFKRKQQLQTHMQRHTGNQHQ